MKVEVNEQELKLLNNIRNVKTDQITIYIENFVIKWIEKLPPRIKF